jgi:hypothetical protein
VISGEIHLHLLQEATGVGLGHILVHPHHGEPGGAVLLVEPIEDGIDWRQGTHHEAQKST